MLGLDHFSLSLLLFALLLFAVRLLFLAFRLRLIVALFGFRFLAM